MIEFNNLESSAIKHIAVKSKTNIKCMTRFMSGKLLMLAKLSLNSFIYSLAELLSFPEENRLVKKIYHKYLIEKILVYHILTDTDSISLQFIVISSLQSTFTEEQVRNILFEIFSENEIGERFDKSDKFWELFGVCKPENQKVLGLYEVESINDPRLVTLAVNPKNILNILKAKMFTKNTKELKKGLQEWILKIKLKGLKEKQHLFKNSLKIKCSEMTFLMFFGFLKFISTQIEKKPLQIVL